MTVQQDIYISTNHTTDYDTELIVKLLAEIDLKVIVMSCRHVLWETSYKTSTLKIYCNKVEPLLRGHPKLGFYKKNTIPHKLYI